MSRDSAAEVTLQAFYMRDDRGRHDDAVFCKLVKEIAEQPLEEYIKAKNTTAIDYCSYMCHAAVHRAAQEGDTSTIDVEQAATLSARWTVALYIAAPDLMESTEFMYMEAAVVTADYGYLHEDLECTIRENPDAAADILKRIYLSEYEAVSACSRRLSLKGLTASAPLMCATQALDVDADKRQALDVDADKVFNYACWWLFNNLNDTEEAALYVLFYFVAAWIAKHQQMPINRLPFCAASGPYFPSMHELFDIWRANKSPVGESALDDVSYKKEVNDLLECITAKAMKMGVARLCDLIRKEGPWIACISDREMDKTFMKKYYSLRDNWSGLDALGLLPLVDASAAKRKRSEADLSAS